MRGICFFLAFLQKHLSEQSYLLIDLRIIIPTVSVRVLIWLSYEWAFRLYTEEDKPITIRECVEFIVKVVLPTHTLPRHTLMQLYALCSN